MPEYRRHDAGLGRWLSYARFLYIALHRSNFRDEIISEALTWLGTPWRHQACCKGAGVDCLHLIAGVMRSFGCVEADRFFATPAWRSYGRHPDATMLFGGCDDLMALDQRGGLMPLLQGA